MAKDFSLKRIKRDLIEALTSCLAEQEGAVEIWVPPSDDSFKCWIIKINVQHDEGSLFKLPKCHLPCIRIKLV